MAAARVRYQPEALIMAPTVQRVENYTTTLLCLLNYLRIATTIEQVDEDGVLFQSLTLMIGTLCTAREELFLPRPFIGTLTPRGIVVHVQTRHGRIRTVIPGGNYPGGNYAIDEATVDAEDIAQQARNHTTAYCETMAGVITTLLGLEDRATVLGLEDNAFQRYITSILRLIDRVAEAFYLLFDGPRLDIEADLVRPYLA
jgi:hypothetical protein